MDKSYIHIYICKDDIVKNVSWNVHARKVNWSERKGAIGLNQLLARLVNN